MDRCLCVPIAAGNPDSLRVERAALPFRRKYNSVFPVCLTSRAEEEDEHLERTLEQNKGKMAKKEEKCALQ